ncbi:MAG TPA: DHHA1 domain-containing protein [Terracidiphilus sp.]|nr:DHHA1 domain-containing protein [Terracidiphilus sp.]
MVDSERLYYSDSFLTSFSGAVTELRPPAENTGGSPWKIRLNRSAFYPTSGGQPFDTGELIASANGSLVNIPVEKVEEDNEGAVWHFVRQPLAAGTPVEGRIDWERRFDHMQQHTGQHLLSAVFLREFQAPTVSFHLGDAISTIDVATGPLTNESLARVEGIANQIIAEDRPVAVRLVSRVEAEAMLASGHVRKLPDRDGVIRLIEIADCDLNACGGTHLRSTGQIGSLLLRRVEKVSRGMRIEFLCGSRAIRAARADAAILAETSALLSSGAAELPAAVRRLLAEEKAQSKEGQKLREELAALQAAQLVSQAPIENGLRLIVRQWKDRDRDYVKLLASRTVAAAPATAVIFSAMDGDPVRLYVARSSDVAFHCGQILREALTGFGLRGGGSPDLAQGDVPAQQEPELQSKLRETILGMSS